MDWDFPATFLIGQQESLNSGGNIMSKSLIKPRLNLAILVGFVAASIPMISLADISYSYTGNNFDNFWNDPGATPFANGDHIAFTFNVPNLLDPLLGIQEIDPDWWTLTVGGLTLGSETGDGLYLAIAPGSTPSATWMWEFSASSSESLVFVDSRSDMPDGSGRIDGAINNSPDLLIDHGDGTYSYSAGGASIQGAPGTWTISAVPEPETWGLMLSGLLLIGIKARCNKLWKYV